VAVLTLRSFQLSLVLVILCLSSPTTSKSEVGKVTEQTGPAEIKRDANLISSALQSGVEMKDTITTANGKTGITFQDDTKVQITEHSKLVIDNFVYDGEKKTGKLGIKMALGTIKYASGQIAKNDPQQVMVETPTATIGVRGTDFSGTVDETGRSTIILLPSCPIGWKDIERDCITGNISVTTIMGTIWLTKPFEAVVVNTSVTKPSSSLLNLNLDQINNMLIVSPAKPVVREQPVERIANVLDADLLGIDFLKYTELEKNYLTEYNKLDKNFLDSDFLMNFLDLSSSQMLTNELAEFNALLPKYNASTGLKYFVEQDNVTLYRESYNSYMELTVSTTHNMTLNLTQDGGSVTQMVNSAGTTTITIKQGN
jgi:hypothetical protein